MHPILIRFHLPFIGNISIYSYGLMVFLGFVAGYFLLNYNTRYIPLKKEIIPDLILCAIIGGILGARILYVILNYRYMRFIDIFKIYEGGLCFYGGFIGGGLAILLYTIKYKLNKADVADIISPSLALGHSFGRIGCFLNGCCYGKKTYSIFGIKFPPDSLVYMFSHSSGYPVHPTQLYSCFGNLIICGILLYFISHRKFKGQIFSLYLILYPINRFTVEFFRADTIFFSSIGITLWQLISIIVFIVGICLYLLFSRKR